MLGVQLSLLDHINANALFRVLKSDKNRFDVQLRSVFFFANFVSPQYNMQMDGLLLQWPFSLHSSVNQLIECNAFQFVWCATKFDALGTQKKSNTV